MKKNNNRKGFTIVELVIVIAVIAILAAVLIPTFSNVIDNANESKALQEAKNAHTEALADIWEDGIVNSNELTKNVGNYTLTFDATGKLSTVTHAQYNFTVTNGTVTAAEKK